MKSLKITRVITFTEEVPFSEGHYLSATLAEAIEIEKSRTCAEVLRDIDSDECTLTTRVVIFETGDTHVDDVGDKS